MKISYFSILLLILISCQNKPSITEERINNLLDASDYNIPENKYYPSNPSDIFNMPEINIEGRPEKFCPQKMVKIEGLYCTNLRHKCIERIDRRRCKKFDKSATVCKGKEAKLSFCIDKEEYTKENDIIPVHNVTWTTANNTCKDSGKRLCYDQEWTLACEGQNRLPFTYGWERNPEICNIDITKNLGRVGNLKDYTRPITDFIGCVSPFGVHNQQGNVDEWVIRPGGIKPYRGMLTGGWWGPIRGACRNVTIEHFEEYSDIQVGFRCCKNL